MKLTLKAGVTTFSLMAALSLDRGALPACASGRHLSDVRSAWTTREERVRTAKITWTERVFKAKGSISESMPQPLRKGPNPIPPEEMSWDSPHTLLLGGDKMRYSFTSQSWSHKEQRFIPFSFESSFNGETLRTFQPAGFTTRAQGAIRPEQNNIDAYNLNVQPILIALRPCDDKLHAPVWNLARFSKANVEGVIRGRRCVVLESRQNSRTSETLWLVAEMGFVVARFSNQIAGKTGFQVDVDYEQHANLGWMPKKWDLLIFGPDGVLRESATSHVTSSAFNMTVRDKQFELAFPPGTWVTDMRAQPERNYITREDGEEHMVEANQALTYEELARNAPGGRLLALSAVGVFIVMCLLGFRSRKKVSKVVSSFLKGGK